MSDILKKIEKKRKTRSYKGNGEQERTIGEVNENLIIPRIISASAEGIMVNSLYLLYKIIQHFKFIQELYCLVKYIVLVLVVLLEEFLVDVALEIFKCKSMYKPFENIDRHCMLMLTYMKILLPSQ